MRLSENGLKLIQAWEGIVDGDPSTVNYEPYICPARVYTVGWGHALTTPSGQIIDVDVFGSVKARELARQAMQRQFGKQAITLDQCRDLLRNDVARFEKAVDKMVIGGATQAQRMVGVRDPADRLVDGRVAIGAGDGDGLVAQNGAHLLHAGGRAHHVGQMLRRGVVAQPARLGGGAGGELGEGEVGRELHGLGPEVLADRHRL